jgi:hypothetical protein
MAEPVHGDRVRGEEIGRPDGIYMWLVCRDCGQGRYLQSRKPPFPERCASCNRAKNGTVGYLGASG